MIQTATFTIPLIVLIFFSSNVLSSSLPSTSSKSYSTLSGSLSYSHSFGFLFPISTSTSFVLTYLVYLEFPLLDLHNFPPLGPLSYLKMNTKPLSPRYYYHWDLCKVSFLIPKLDIISQCSIPIFYEKILPLLSAYHHNNNFKELTQVILLLKYLLLDNVLENHFGKALVDHSFTPLVLDILC